MSYAIIRVKLPVVKNLRIFCVVGRTNDHTAYDLYIENVRYIRNGKERIKKPTAAKAGTIKQSKGIARIRRKIVG